MIFIVKKYPLQGGGLQKVEIDLVKLKKEVENEYKGYTINHQEVQHLANESCLTLSAKLIPKQKAEFHDIRFM